MFFGAALEGLPVEEFKAVRFDPPLVFADVDGSPLTVNDGETLRSYHKSLDPRFDNICHLEARRRQVRQSHGSH